MKNGRTISVSIGPFGGFYVFNGYTKRLCLGWLAITYFPFEIDTRLPKVNENKNS